ncbi:lipoprotein [Halomonas sp.]|uniref:lipoprotein n=1 Tax=Halomonas sp. TaxID=1486246 RepID=UPI00298E9D71|nr:lipoprotein [Halomonas sp.]MDW7748661.1 lipoprotein [Halomonas sp.]
MKRSFLILLLVAWLAGCATPAPPEPREILLAAAPETTLRETMHLLMERGYVIRHADGDLGRLEAVLGRMPGYGVSLRVAGQGEGSRVSFIATRGGRPLPPTVLDPLLTDLQSRLGLLP